MLRCGLGGLRTEVFGKILKHSLRCVFLLLKWYLVFTNAYNSEKSADACPLRTPITWCVADLWTLNKWAIAACFIIVHRSAANTPYGALKYAVITIVSKQNNFPLRPSGTVTIQFGGFRWNFFYQRDYVHKILNDVDLCDFPFQCNSKEH